MYSQDSSFYLTPHQNSHALARYAARDIAYLESVIYPKWKARGDDLSHLDAQINHLKNIRDGEIDESTEKYARQIRQKKEFLGFSLVTQAIHPSDVADRLYRRVVENLALPEGKVRVSEVHRICELLHSEYHQASRYALEAINEYLDTTRSKISLEAAKVAVRQAKEFEHRFNTAENDIKDITNQILKLVASNEWHHTIEEVNFVFHQYSLPSPFDYATIQITSMSVQDIFPNGIPSYTS